MRLARLACLFGAFASIAMPAGTAAASTSAQDMDVPMDVQLPILLKVLSFDRKLPVRAPREIVIGVAYQGGNRESTLAQEEGMRVIGTQAAPGGTATLRVVPIDLDESTIAQAHAKRALTHLYVAPLRATDVRAIAAWAREAGVTTMTGVSRYVADGLAIGVGLRGGRPRILVNVEASRLEGADLSAELLKLADIVR